jgi:cellulose synthase/poly-beta-1,6-N-acetylglucosamine synthase-like glycosyltransferase
MQVDADTRVYPDSLRMMVNCMQNDPLTMGLCGETRIANKRDSWVTMIQGMFFDNLTQFSSITSPITLEKGSRACLVV